MYYRSKAGIVVKWGAVPGITFHQGLFKSALLPPVAAGKGNEARTPRAPPGDLLSLGTLLLTTCK